MKIGTLKRIYVANIDGVMSASTIIEALFFELIDGNRTLSNQSITEAELGPVFE